MATQNETLFYILVHQIPRFSFPDSIFNAAKLILQIHLFRQFIFTQAYYPDF